MKKLFFLLSVTAFAISCDAQTDSLFVTTSDSVKLFVKRSGKGFPVLVIHGGPGISYEYLEKEGINVFEKDAEIIYLSQRGCGRSEKSKSNDYSLKRMIKDFEEVRQALGVKQWILMPHSFGGVLATEYAYDYPTSIKAMIYLNCSIDGLTTFNSFVKNAVMLLPSLSSEDKNYLLNDSILIFERYGKAEAYLRQNDVYYKTGFDKKENYLLDESIVSKTMRHPDLLRAVPNNPEYFQNFSSKTAVIKIPVLIIAGTRDFTVGLEQPQLMHFPDRQLKLIEGGHYLFLEHNQELYKSIQPFLLRHAKTPV